MLIATTSRGGEPSLEYFIFFSDYFPQSFSVCITNIIRIIESIKIKSDWMVVLHQLVAAFVSLVQMVQLATKCRNVGESVTLHLVVKYALCAC